MIPAVYDRCRRVLDPQRRRGHRRQVRELPRIGVAEPLLKPFDNLR